MWLNGFLMRSVKPAGTVPQNDLRPPHDGTRCLPYEVLVWDASFFRVFFHPNTLRRGSARLSFRAGAAEFGQVVLRVLMPSLTLPWPSSLLASASIGPLKAMTFELALRGG